MELDWQLIGTVLFGVGQIVALASAYYGLKADNAALANVVAMGLLTEKFDRLSQAMTFRADIVASISLVEATVTHISERVAHIETGADEWSKTLRTRTHELANQLNVLALKVDRLERPGSTLVE